MCVMFGDCYNLESLDLSNFKTQDDTNLHQMFCGFSVGKENFLAKDKNIINEYNKGNYSDDDY